MPASCGSTAPSVPAWMDLDVESRARATIIDAAAPYRKVRSWHTMPPLVAEWHAFRPLGNELAGLKNHWVSARGWRRARWPARRPGQALGICRDRAGALRSSGCTYDCCGPLTARTLTVLQSRMSVGHASALQGPISRLRDPRASRPLAAQTLRRRCVRRPYEWTASCSRSTDPPRGVSEVPPRFA
jgi:hypothetical protein